MYRSFSQEEIRELVGMARVYAPGFSEERFDALRPGPIPLPTAGQGASRAGGKGGHPSAGAWRAGRPGPGISPGTEGE